MRFGKVFIETYKTHTNQVNLGSNYQTAVIKTFIYELDVSYAPTYIFRSNGYLNYN